MVPDYCDDEPSPFAFFSAARYNSLYLPDFSHKLLNSEPSSFKRFYGDDQRDNRVSGFGAHKWSVKLGDLAVGQDEQSIIVDDRGESMGNGDQSRVFELGPNGFLDRFIGSKVHRSSGLIHDLEPNHQSRVGCLRRR